MLNDYLKSPRDVRLELAERAKAERLRQNLTQEALAHAAGISLSTLRRFEKTGDIALASFVDGCVPLALIGVVSAVVAGCIAVVG